MSSPLAGKKLLVTREKNQAKELTALLEKKEAHPIVTPLLKFASIPLEDVANTLEEISKYDWIFFTSANTVHFFQELTKNKTIDLPMKIAAVGEKTAKALLQYGYKTDFIPSLYNGETLVNEFYTKYGTESVAYLCGEKARPEIPSLFEEYGIQFKKIVLYRTIMNKDIREDLKKIIQEDKLDGLLFTSPSTVEAFCEMIPDHLLPTIKANLLAVAIGTTTASSLEHYNFQQVIYPEKFTIDEMVREVESYFLMKNR